ncbi:MAG TPA: hypothetical protein VMR70_01620 [Flavisolibacter sp.]|nr:hypothetical protein [Flavisolibacter sp.]
MKKTLLFFGAVLLLLSSCQREIEFDPATQSSSDSCRLVKAYYYDNGMLTDSVTYEYKNDLVSKINYWNGHLLFYYDGEKIIHRKQVDTTGGFVASADDYFSYNAADQLTLIKKYETTAAGVTFLFDSVLLSYTGNQLSRVQGYFASLTTPVMSLDEEAVFTYTGNNITQTITDKQPDPETARYEYDNQPNYFRKLYRQPLLTEPLALDVFFDNWPVTLSANNVTRITYTNETARNEVIDYVPDAKGRLSLVKSNGLTRVRYVYGCQ